MEFKYVLEFKVHHNCKLKNYNKYLLSDLNKILDFLYKNDIRDCSSFHIRKFIGGVEL